MSKSKKHIPEWSQRWWHTLDYNAGSGLDRAEVINLKKILTADPNHGIARLLLAGYYQRALYEKPLRVRDASEYIDHLLWLIDNDFANPDLQFATTPSDTIWFEQVKVHWQKAVRNNPDDVQVLVSAAHFFSSEFGNISREIVETSTSS